MRILSVVGLGFFWLWAGAGTAAAAPYLSGVSVTSCAGAKTCSLSFAAVPSGMTLTVTHLSCGIVTSGEVGGVDNVVLRTASAGAGALGDHQLFTAELYGSSNAITVVSSSTAFYVTAGDKPVIDITSTGNIVATTDGGCLVSGTMAK